MDGNDSDRRMANVPERGGAALLDERVWLRATLSCIGDAVIVTDARGCVVSLNPLAQSLTGYTQEEAAGRPVTDVFHIINEESRRPAECPTTKALREGVVVGLANHTLLVAKDGTERPIDDSAATICNEQGVVAGVVLIFQDVTERRRQERALREALAYAESIIATVREPLIVLDKSLRVKTANRAFYRTFHVSPEETENRLVFELGDRQWDIPRLRALLEDVLPHNHSFQDYEVEHDFPTIGRRVMLLNARRVVKENDGTDLILLAIEDITERRRAEELKEANRRKDEFLAILSHELRNPLAPIMNAVQIIRLERTDNPAQRQARIMLERQVRQIARLIEDLLQVARIMQGKVQLHKEPVELSDIVGQAVEAARPLIDGRNHELSVSLPPAAVWLEADPTRLEQVLTNLLNNAAKYTDPGGRIRLTATLDAAGRQVLIKVGDSGIGIAPDLLPRIFDLFTQGDRSLDRSQGGLGIGLTVVRNLVEKHGGTVEVSSAGLGKGTEFTVRLPVLPEPAPQQQPDTPAPAPPPSRPLRVLVVDDNKDMVDSLVVLLRTHGYEVCTAHSGLEALEAASAGQPDIILLDIGLPEMDGWQVARRLRGEKGLQQALLVAITGYGQEADFTRSREAGFDYHLVKPIDPDKLQDLLADLQGKHAH